ncbi:MAG: hypothetical protein ACK5GF_01850 [Rhodoluna sp.]|jgi:hypothetical protein
MISIRRILVAGIPLVYLFYLPIQSILLPDFASRTIEIAALTIYLLVGVPTLLAFTGIRIPIWLALINLFAAVVLPALIILQRQEIGNDKIGAWVVMGTGVILTAAAVRQHPRIAVLGLASLITQIVLSYGPISLIRDGLVGAIVFVLAGLGVSRGIRRANEDTEKYLAQQTKSLAAIAALEAAESARQERLQEVLKQAIPMLKKITSATGALDSSDRNQAKLLELTLRDEMRGRALMIPALKGEVARLRSLGVEVAVLDEGGMDDLDLPTKEQLLQKAIAALVIVSIGRVTIRSPKNESFRLTVVATIPGQAAPVVNLRF